MDINNIQEVLGKLQKLSTNSNPAPAPIDNQSLKEISVAIVSKSINNVQTAMLQALLEKINPAELELLKFSLFSTSSSSDGADHQQAFLQNILKLLAQPEINSKQTEFIKSALKNSGILQKALDSTFTNSPDLLSEALAQLPAEKINSDSPKAISTLLIKQLQEIVSTKDIVSLQKAWQLMINPASMESTGSTEKKLALQLTELFKLAGLAHPATESVQISDSQMSDLLAEKPDLLRALITQTLQYKEEPVRAVQYTQLQKLLITMTESVNKNPAAKITSCQQMQLALDLIRLSVELKSTELIKLGISVLNQENPTVRSVLELMLSFKTANAEKAFNVLKNKQNQPNQKSDSTEQTTLLKIANRIDTGTTAEKLQHPIADTLNRLNQGAEKLGLPSYQLLSLPFANSMLELSFKNQPVVDENSQEKQHSNRKSETVECTILLPNLGTVGIKISIFGNNVGIALNSENAEACKQIQKISDCLSDKITASGFEKPLIGVSQQSVSQIKPDWLLDLINMNQVC